MFILTIIQNLKAYFALEFPCFLIIHSPSVSRDESSILINVTLKDCLFTFFIAFPSGSILLVFFLFPS